MKKKSIIKKNTEFSEIINAKRIFRNRIYAIYISNKKETNNRYGISIPTKTGNAVIRNKLKRQIKDIIDKSGDDVEKKYDYIIIVRKEVINLSYSELKSNLFHLLNMIKKEGNYEKK